MKPLIVLIIFTIGTSCTATYHTTTPPDKALLVPDVNTRTITGITKNGKKYTAIDGKGRKAPNIKSDTISENRIGQIMFLK